MCSRSGRNGHYGKTVMPRRARERIAVPRDRSGSFDPKIVPKGHGGCLTTIPQLAPALINAPLWSFWWDRNHGPPSANVWGADLRAAEGRGPEMR